MSRIYLYKAKDAESHKEIGRKLQELPDGQYVVKITRNKPIRSLAANGFFHMVCQIYATHTGHYLDEIKDEFKNDIGFYTMHTDKLGKQIKRLKQSSSLDETEMASLINQLLQWGRDKFPEVIIPRKEDATYLQWIQVENDYNRTFSGY